LVYILEEKLEITTVVVRGARAATVEFITFRKNQADIGMDWTGFTRTFGLFFATAVAELVGCYLPLLWISGKGSAWLLLPAALSLAVFVWLR